MFPTMSSSEPHGGPRIKVATKSPTQIHKENTETIQFYLKMIGGSNALFLLIYGLISYDYISTGLMVKYFLTVGLQLGSLKAMKSIATPSYNEKGKVDDVSDLGMSMFGEIFKDLIILCSGVQVLTVLSTYFWWLLMLIPLYLVYLLWSKVLAPWIFAPAPEPEEPASNTAKKKLKRQQEQQQQPKIKFGRR